MTTPRLLMAAVAMSVALTACGRSSSQYQTTTYSPSLPPRPAGCPDAAYEEQLLRTTGHLCPETERLNQAIQSNQQEIYDLDVQQYGRKAVLECRSRMSWRAPTYPYCLEANRGR